MSLTVSNTLSGDREEFEPRDPDEVTMYYCGLTVSDDAHLGHARSWIHTDVMRRWLVYLGYDVRYVENFTDINEKIVARIGSVGDDERAVARHFTSRVLADMRALNLERAAVYPRVSEHIPEIVSLIERLIDAGYAYEADGSVYFDVTAFSAYGRLSNQDLDGMEPQDALSTNAKRNAQDFALWKGGGVDAEEIAEHRTTDSLPATEAIAGAETFPSPWGDGRPGWHIECSAMSTTHLGDTFDIHVAGRDIVFPHNENEIAQSVAASGEEYARYWLHTGLLRTEGDKMSSSLENYFLVRDAIDRFGPNVIRTFMLSSVYSAEQTFSEKALAEATERWERLSRAYARAVEAADSVDAGSKPGDGSLREAVSTSRSDIIAAMNDDFNTREAMTALLSLASSVNAHIDEHSPFDYPGLAGALAVFETFGGRVFGLSFEPEGVTDDRLSERLIDLVLDLRARERKAGDFERADAIRHDLEALGIVVEDAESGPTYRLDPDAGVS